MVQQKEIEVLKKEYYWNLKKEDKNIFKLKIWIKNIKNLPWLNVEINNNLLFEDSITSEIVAKIIIKAENEISSSGFDYITHNVEYTGNEIKIINAKYFTIQCSNCQKRFVKAFDLYEQKNIIYPYKWLSSKMTSEHSFKCPLCSENIITFENILFFEVTYDCLGSVKKKDLFTENEIDIFSKNPENKILKIKTFRGITDYANNSEK